MFYQANTTKVFLRINSVHTFPCFRDIKYTVMFQMHKISFGIDLSLNVTFLLKPIRSLIYYITINTFPC